MNEKIRDAHTHFSNRACRFFPCHPNADADSFNCLFCFCPLYTTGDACGGSFTYTEEGVKDCTGCILPHAEGGYDYVTSRFPLIVEVMRKAGRP